MTIIFLLTWALDGLVAVLLCSCTIQLSECWIANKHHPSSSSFLKVFDARNGSWSVGNSPGLLGVTERQSNSNTLGMISMKVLCRGGLQGLGQRFWNCCHSPPVTTPSAECGSVQRIQHQLLPLPVQSETRPSSSHWPFRHAQELNPDMSCPQIWQKAGACLILLPVCPSSSILHSSQPALSSSKHRDNTHRDNTPCHGEAPFPSSKHQDTKNV